MQRGGNPNARVVAPEDQEDDHLNKKAAQLYFLQQQALEESEEARKINNVLGESDARERMEKARVAQARWDAKQADIEKSKQKDLKPQAASARKEATPSVRRSGRTQPETKQEKPKKEEPKERAKISGKKRKRVNTQVSQSKSPSKVQKEADKETIAKVLKTTPAAPGKKQAALNQNKKSGTIEIINAKIRTTTAKPASKTASPSREEEESHIQNSVSEQTDKESFHNDLMDDAAESEEKETPEGDSKLEGEKDETEEEKEEEEEEDVPPLERQVKEEKRPSRKSKK